MANDSRQAGTSMVPRRGVLLLDTPKARFNLLRGRLGSGKSTLVAKRAAEQARQLTEASATWRDPDTAAAHRPLRLLLREHIEHIPPERGDESAELVWRLIEAELARRLQMANVHELMGELRPELTRRGSFYFDGFDEVPESDGRRPALRRSLVRFAEALGPDACILVTGRPHALLDRDGLGWAGFRLLAIEPLDPERVEQLVDRVHGRIGRALGWDDEVRERRASDLKVALRERDYLMELASRPLMLSLILALHLRRVRLPEDRAELYEQVIDLLLSRWQQRPDGASELVPDLLRPVLFGEPGIVRDRIQALAWDIHARHQGSADQDRAGAGDAVSDREVLGLFAEGLPDNVGAKPLLEFLDQRAGLLVRGTGNHFDFPHRSCREYLACCHLVDSEPDPGERLVALVREDPGWWREVFLLAVGKVRLGGLANALGIVARLLPADGTSPERLAETQWRDIALAARALVELRVVERAPRHPFTGDTLRRVVDWTQHLLSEGHLTAAERAKAGEYLGALGDPRLGVGLDGRELPLIAWIGPLSGQLPVPDGTGWLNLPVAAFQIARFPVSVAQYAAFVAAGGYEDPSLWQGEGWNWRQTMGDHANPYAWREQQAHPNRPVVGVSWYEAMAFCRWLSRVLGESIRLPTERQWQFAAGGEERRPFPWGEAAADPETRANTSGSGIGAPVPVGIYPAGASPEGVMDLAGNVWEWCCDAFEDPPGFELGDCDGKSLAELRVARGRSWWSSAAELLDGSREGFRPALRDRGIGLRLVRQAVAN